MAEAQPGRGQDAAQPPPVQQHRPAAQPPCWYAVLGVAPVAGAEEIRRAYRQAALRLHPDKAGSGSGDVAGSCRGDGVGAGATAGDEFWLVQQAWEALQDPGRRAAYDRQRALATVAQEVPIHESVELEEMEPGDAEGLPCRCWPCRCGGAYLLLDDDVATASAAAAGDGAAGPLPAELAVPCSTCSLHIRVLLA